MLDKKTILAAGKLVADNFTDLMNTYEELSKELYYMKPKLAGDSRSKDTILDAVVTSYSPDMSLPTEGVIGLANICTGLSLLLSTFCKTISENAKLEYGGCRTTILAGGAVMAAIGLQISETKYLAVNIIFDLGKVQSAEQLASWFNDPLTAFVNKELPFTAEIRVDGYSLTGMTEYITFRDLYNDIFTQFIN